LHIPTTITTVETESLSAHTILEPLDVFPEIKLLDRTSLAPGTITRSAMPSMVAGRVKVVFSGL
jgi:hypothetical protein